MQRWPLQNKLCLCWTQGCPDSCAPYPALGTQRDHRAAQGALVDSSEWLLKEALPLPSFGRVLSNLSFYWCVGLKLPKSSSLCLLWSVIYTKYKSKTSLKYRCVQKPLSSHPQTLARYQRTMVSPKLSFLFPAIFSFVPGNRSLWMLLKYLKLKIPLKYTFHELNNVWKHYKNISLHFIFLISITDLKNLYLYKVTYGWSDINSALVPQLWIVKETEYGFVC